MRVLGTPQSAHRPTLVRLAPVDARRAAQSRNSFRLQAEPEPTSQRTPPPDKGPPSDADNKAAEYVTWPAVNNPPPRRLILGSLTGAGIVLGGNLFGITGALLGLDGGKVAEQLQLDTIIPVLGYKRCVSPDGFQFLYPAKWLGDQTLYRRKVESTESGLGFNLPDIGDAERVARRRREAFVEPSVAFGPMGGVGEDNISAIVAPSPGLKLPNLGTPASVGQELLDKQLATASSGKVGEILAATSYERGGITYYLLEYKLRKDAGARPWQRHFLAVLCARNEKLYTLTTQCMEAKWPEYESVFRKAADSFAVAAVAPGLGRPPQGVPQGRY